VTLFPYAMHGSAIAPYARLVPLFFQIDVTFITTSPISGSSAVG
jgi:hypothetical protein